MILNGEQFTPNSPGVRHEVTMTARATFPIVNSQEATGGDPARDCSGPAT